MKCCAKSTKKTKTKETKMIYNLGDKFLYKGEETVVVSVNNTRGWLALAEAPWMSITMIEVDGRDKQGNRAVPIFNNECLAV